MSHPPLCRLMSRVPFPNRVLNGGVDAVPRDMARSRLGERRTTLIASIRAFGAAFFFAGGFWLVLLLCCALPMCLSGGSDKPAEMGRQFTLGAAVYRRLAVAMNRVPEFQRLARRPSR